MTTSSRKSETGSTGPADSLRPADNARLTIHEVLDGVRACIAQVLGIDLKAVGPGVTLLQLGAQSFDFMHLVFRLEATYRVELPRAYAIPDQHTAVAYADAVMTALQERE